MADEVTWTITHENVNIPEPPDGARIEWEYGTDVYGAWKDVRGSVATGWRPEECWVVYPGSVPQTWMELVETFGESLAGAFLLAPVGMLTHRVPAGYTPEGRRQRDEFLSGATNA